MVYLDTNIFLFFFFFFNNEEVCDCGYMHRPRLGESWLDKTRKMMSGHIYII